jgi:hypothetical protein
MNDSDTGPRLPVQVRDVQPGSADFGQVLALAARVLAQDRHLVSSVRGAQESRVLGAFDGTRCAGFLRYLIQVIGAGHRQAQVPTSLRNHAPRNCVGRFRAHMPRTGRWPRSS